MQYKIKLAYAALAAILAWVAVGLQFYVPVPGTLETTRTFMMSITQIFSYFTILTNLLIAITYSFILLSPNSKPGRFLSQTATLTGIAVYIGVITFIYELLLRDRWDVDGLMKTADILLHTVNPIAFLIFWFVFVPKQQLRWMLAIYWLIYPLVYLIWILIRGEILNVYPYHFINVVNLGYTNVIVNCLWVLLAFLSFSGIFLSISRLLAPTTVKINR
ncbi:MAG: hypothetical protein EOP47_07710 [Sphingobacteriaceae bacterium]|nr:MAG: hypothetical protein EOP47_07710 [Sphingobacteriaceae bacterium]